MSALPTLTSGPSVQSTNPATQRPASVSDIFFKACMVLDTLLVGGAPSFGSFEPVRASSKFNRAIFGRDFATIAYFLALGAVSFGLIASSSHAPFSPFSPSLSPLTSSSNM
ncbi:hypothetical protein FRC03_010337 [Tulasnella sp. 419]|nr:hypothetical protein FRC03_010337 [Tulasnella sp. 419]